MPIRTQAITSDQRDLLIHLEEGHFADVKSVHIRPAPLTEAISALANADGGELYIGLDEDLKTKRRSWRGFANPEAANAHIQVFEGLFPLGRDFEYTFLKCEGVPGLVLQVSIRKTRDIKRASSGTPYIRRGAQNLPVASATALRQLEYTKGLTSFETEIVDVPTSTVTNSRPVISFMLRVIPTAEPDEWLRKQQLIREDKPTVAGVLLFAEEPQAALPKRSGIKLYRYRTRDAEGSRDTMAFDPTTIEGPVYDQIHSAVNETVKVVQTIGKLGEEALERVTYPPEALHEIITNAVIHRDYSLADDIHIRVFDNRIEVQSPGRLPAHITPENILDERFARNGNIVRLLNKFPDPPNKDIGEGLNTAFAAMTRLGLKEPTIAERPNSVLVTIKHEPLASPEQIILEYLEEHQSIQNKDARRICHIPEDWVVRGTFKRLEQRKLIVQVRGTRTSSTAYRQGPQFHNWRGTLSESEPTT